MLVNVIENSVDSKLLVELNITVLYFVVTLTFMNIQNSEEVIKEHSISYYYYHILGVEINVPVADVDFKCVDEPLKLGIGSPHFGKGYSKCKKKI